jgi:hypothetical protein
MPTLRFTAEAKSVLDDLAESPQYARKLKKVRNALARLEANPRHPGLNSHKYVSMRGEAGQDVWDSYVENSAPSAWRIFWHYGPEADQITIVTIGPHP